MGLVLSNMVGTFPLREGEKSPRRAVILAILPGLVAFLMGCERTSTSTTEVQGGNPNALVRLEITSNPPGQVWVGNVSDNNSTVSISGTTPFSQDIPAPEGLAVGIRKVSTGGDLTVCLTNLSTGERLCRTTSAPNGVISLAVAN